MGTTVVGLLSGIMWVVPNGLMAAAMACCFSFGTIWLAEKERRRPGSVGMADAILVGAASGMIAAFPVMLLEMLRLPPTKMDHLRLFKPPSLEIWYLIAAPILYGIAIHWTYQLRKGSMLRGTRAFVAACLSTGALRLIFEVLKGTDGAFHGMQLRHFVQVLIASGFMFLFTMVPFAGGWVYVSVKADPSNVGPLCDDRTNDQRETSVSGRV